LQFILTRGWTFECSRETAPADARARTRARAHTHTHTHTSTHMVARLVRECATAQQQRLAASSETGDVAEG